MVASSGDRLLEPAAEQAYVDLLLPHAAVLTPNLLEAQALLGAGHRARSPSSARRPGRWARSARGSSSSRAATPPRTPAATRSTSSGTAGCVTELRAPSARHRQHARHRLHVRGRRRRRAGPGRRVADAVDGRQGLRHARPRRRCRLAARRRPRPARPLPAGLSPRLPGRPAAWTLVCLDAGCLDARLPERPAARACAQATLSVPAGAEHGRVQQRRGAASEQRRRAARRRARARCRADRDEEPRRAGDLAVEVARVERGAPGRLVDVPQLGDGELLARRRRWRTASTRAWRGPARRRRRAPCAWSKASRAASTSATGTQADRAGRRAGPRRRDVGGEDQVGHRHHPHPRVAVGRAERPELLDVRDARGARTPVSCSSRRTAAASRSSSGRTKPPGSASPPRNGWVSRSTSSTCSRALAHGQQHDVDGHGERRERAAGRTPRGTPPRRRGRSRELDARRRQLGQGPLGGRRARPRRTAPCSRRTGRPAARASRALARTQWSVAMPQTSRASTPRSASQAASGRCRPGACPRTRSRPRRARPCAPRR